MRTSRSHQAILAVAAVVAAVACAHGPAPAPTVSSMLAAPRSTAERELGASMFGRLVALVAGDQERLVGQELLLHGASVCECSIGVLPMVWASHQEPRVGVPYRCQWTTLALSAPNDWPALLLLQTAGEPVSADLTWAGLAGCWVHVDLAHARLIAPEARDDAWLHRPPEDGGRIELRWTPSAEWAGRSVTMQLVVLVPRDVAASGILLSPGLQLTVGR